MKITWPQVAVVGLIVGALMVALVLGRSTTELMLLGTTILAALGLGKSEQIAKQTNGNQSAQLDLIRELSHKVAEMTPPAPPAEDVRPVSPAA